MAINFGPGVVARGPPPATLEEAIREILAEAGAPINFGGQGGYPGRDERMAELTADLPAGASPAAAPAPKKQSGLMRFLGAFAGNLGDSLTGNPVYANATSQQREVEQLERWYERKRQDELVDLEKQLKIKARYTGEDKPSLQREQEWLSRLSPEERSVAMEQIKLLRPGQFVPPAPVTLPYGATIQGEGEGGSLPTPSTAEERDALPPGTQYRAPDGTIKVKGGASPSNGSPDFR